MKDIESLKDVYATLLVEYARKNEEIVIVESDLMKSCGIDKFKDEFPKRSIDVGVAEANMIGIAAGLSLMGKIPFTQTFAIFASHRCLDQIYLSVAYAKLNVKMCGSDPGITTELNGGTHESIDDLGIMRAIPTMTIFEPCDAHQLRMIFPQIVDHYGPVYIRLCRGVQEQIYDEKVDFVLGKAVCIKEGRDISIVAFGVMVKEALDASMMLEKEGVNAEVIHIHTLKPLDEDMILASARKTKGIVTIENGSIINGLGSAVAECLSEHYPCHLKRIGVKDRFGEIGHFEELKKHFEMDREHIVKACKEIIEKQKEGK